MSRPVKASIDTSALRQNQQIVRRAAPGSRLWAVVKANAYGHGLARVWNALSAADGFAMLNLEEAILLRELGWKGPILMLEGFFHADELALFDKYRLTTSVHSNWQIKALQQAKLHAPLDIYVKVNSGMNRLGFMPDRLQIVWQQLRGLKNVSEMTLMSHFAEAENPHGIVEPMRRIEQAAEGLDCPRSLANSAATLWHPESHFNWVRPGIVLYGASPSGLWQDVANTGLKPVMTLSSEIIAVQNLKPGEAVGYGGIYRTTQEQRIGIVACGYADGYPRLAPSGTPVLVDGVRTVTVGRISMDMLAVDLTPCPQAGIGTPVELWGKEIKIDDVAATSGTVGYELMCALAPRVPVVTV
ncbi:catabolic alanine racemase DadX [Klebsiella spallanzanii]|uniref:Alanine racemase n=1 Tax=Klebsiella spallanzanii TaxID=2587528 RepID=A0A564LCL6_9ENTR|nr:catabolic alanine racemase DadX [Klebsiella spallanzanii]VUS79385.1 Alanine racemase, catabolic [Klebsiella spallanzanii]VUS92279.1 Alanine racemase, catabolic [Klebsiella spallanzanii]